MASSSRLLLVLFIFLILSTLAAGQSCDTSRNFTANSTYGRNRNLLLSSLASNVTTNGGYFSTTVGQGSVAVYAHGLCRGDLSDDDCFKCIDDPSRAIINNCPNQVDAIGWGHDKCIVQCSNQSFFDRMETHPSMCVYNTADIEYAADDFDQSLSNLANDLIIKAEKLSSSGRKMATGSGGFGSFGNVYALMQCVPQLSSSDCRDCLEEAFRQYKTICNRKRAITLLTPSCIFQYGMSRFYEYLPDVEVPQRSPPPPLQPPPPPSPPTADLSPPVTDAGNKGTSVNGGGNNRLQTAVLVVVPVISLLVLLTIMIGVSSKLRISKEHDEEGLGRRSDLHSEELNQKANEWRQQQCSDIFDQEEDSLQFELNKLRAATNNFSSENQIGMGGFGPVYKGKLPNGQEIAVKRLAQGSKQGEREFKNEITLMVKLHHRNLTKLHGFCLDGKERLLVYEFVPNKSLDHFLFDPIRRMLLNWEARYKIILGVASGLLYLHEGSPVTVIHHDLKASNVLLDDKMNPRISDFGMSRLFHVDNSQTRTNRIAGTLGYMPPEFADYGQYSTKTDVFSFGVMILEIVSGRSITSSELGGEHLLSYAWQRWRKGKAKSLIDPTIIDGSLTEKMRCIHIGLLCVQHSVVKRPTMASVMLMFNRSTVSLAIPTKPGFYMTESVMSSGQHGIDRSSTSNQPVGSSIYHASFTDPYPR